LNLLALLDIHDARQSISERHLELFCYEVDHLKHLGVYLERRSGVPGRASGDQLLQAHCLRCFQDPSPGHGVLCLNLTR
jgi:hypothetical protein